MAMYTDAGGDKVARMVEHAVTLTATAHPKTVLNYLQAGMAEIAKAGHEEVYDTAVREAILVAIEPAWEANYVTLAGWIL